MTVSPDSLDRLRIALEDFIDSRFDDLVDRLVDLETRVAEIESDTGELDVVSDDVATIREVLLGLDERMKTKFG